MLIPLFSFFFFLSLNFLVCYPPNYKKNHINLKSKPIKQGVKTVFIMSSSLSHPTVPKIAGVNTFRYILRQPSLCSYRHKYTCVLICIFSVHIWLHHISQYKCTIIESVNNRNSCFAHFRVNTCYQKYAIVKILFCLSLHLGVFIFIKWIFPSRLYSVNINILF